ncbi:hypothetical protein LCM4579_23050 [Ensifer sp. LCM 4579]|nr:hypothetical protein LCM4579_23050 [Ensifer sp. LCM 4579]
MLSKRRQAFTVEFSILSDIGQSAIELIALLLNSFLLWHAICVEIGRTRLQHSAGDLEVIAMDFSGKATLVVTPTWGVRENARCDNHRCCASYDAGHRVGDAESSAEQRSIECSGITTQTITQIQVTERT